MSEFTRTVEIRNSKGLHARTAAKFCKTAGLFEAEIRVLRGENDVSGRSIMGLMMLAAAIGCSIEIRTSGPDAQSAMDALTTLVTNKFDEE